MYVVSPYNSCNAGTCITDIDTDGVCDHIMDVQMYCRELVTDGRTDGLDCWGVDGVLTL